MGIRDKVVALNWLWLPRKVKWSVAISRRPEFPPVGHCAVCRASQVGARPTTSWNVRLGVNTLTCLLRQCRWRYCCRSCPKRTADGSATLHLAPCQQLGLEHSKKPRVLARACRVRPAYSFLSSCHWRSCWAVDCRFSIGALSSRRSIWLHWRRVLSCYSRLRFRGDSALLFSHILGWCNSGRDTFAG